MSTSTSKLRLFVGLKPPGDVSERLCAAAREALGGLFSSAWRLYPPEHVHLTLCFLGLVEVERVTALREGLARETAGLAAPELEIAGLGAFPTLARPRVLWAGVRGRPAELERLERIANACLRAARVAGTPPVGARTAEKGGAEADFTPHLTLARPRRDALRPKVPDAFLGLDFAERWRPGEVCLFESRLDAAAADRYPALVRFPLG